MGFKEEIDDILTFVPSKRSIWLFSATVKSGIKALMKSHMKDPVSVSVSHNQVTATNTKQYFSLVSRKDRIVALSRFIDVAQEFYGFIFCPTKILTAEVAERLVKLGYKAGALHGDMNQAQRNRTIQKFKKKEYDILVATDVAARGIDVADITHVINYSLPEDQESYVHRIGRTGRAGKSGTAITFINRKELYRLNGICKRFKVKIDPIDVPSVHDIGKQKIKYIETFCKSQNGSVESPFSKDIEKILGVLSEEEKNAVLRLCLEDKFFKGLHGKDSKAFSSTILQMKKATPDDFEQQELFLNLGMQDGVNKSDVISLCKRYAKVFPNQLGKVRVIKRRSFITVTPKLAQQIKTSLDGKHFARRKVHVALVQ